MLGAGTGLETGAGAGCQESRAGDGDRGTEQSTPRRFGHV
ncbi:putative multicopper oxidase [Streptomyces hygroscopicus subsp. jinggangensis TL01]|nr:putative multicopper oxidase [Streptomyces hygroscopicus subsp. jinggangensis TL01]